MITIPSCNRSIVAAIAIVACTLLTAPSQAQDTRKLESLTVEQAREVVAKKAPPLLDGLGSWLSLDGLTSLSPDVAEVLVEPAGALSLNGLTELSPEAAAVLARHKPLPHFGQADLRLNGLKTLSPAAAEALATHEGMILLHSLEKLDSAPLAKKLTAQWGELRLGITDLSPEIAAELAKNEGVAEDKTRPGVIHRRADRAPSVLRLDNIKSLSPETAEALAKHRGVLVLNGLVSLEPAVAASLAKRTGTLVLNGLQSLSTEAAAALAAFPGELVLKGIPELTPETAAALANHKGRLHLTGLTALSLETRAALKGHANLLLPRPSAAAADTPALRP
jgi:hypothetical protein